MHFHNGPVGKTHTQVGFRLSVSVSVSRPDLKSRMGGPGFDLESCMGRLGRCSHHHNMKITYIPNKWPQSTSVHWHVGSQLDLVPSDISDMA